MQTGVRDAVMQRLDNLAMLAESGPDALAPLMDSEGSNRFASEVGGIVIRFSFDQYTRVLFVHSLRAASDPQLSVGG